ncbi:MAG: ankyrin repeat domain-containing protein [Alphaproteobacteria bacterium]|nr:MAG: ankyrin repeat domain-containing protein [Alphaproteobacteria bacterium]
MSGLGSRRFALAAGALVLGFALVLAPVQGTAQFSPTFELLQALKKSDFYGIKTNALKGANVNARDDDGVPALVIAAEMRQPGVVKFLIEQGAHVNATTEREKETALMRAVAAGDKTSVAVLLYYGADPNMGDRLGETALMKAARTGKSEIVDLLIEAGADLHLGDNTGLTALDYAKRARKRQIVKQLEEAGAEY